MSLFLNPQNDHTPAQCLEISQLFKVNVFLMNQLLCLALYLGAILNQRVRFIYSNLFKIDRSWRMQGQFGEETSVFFYSNQLYSLIETSTSNSNNS